jgi:hypothetical protein
MSKLVEFEVAECRNHCLNTVCVDNHCHDV